MDQYERDEVQEDTEISNRARSLARLIDRQCRQPGTWSLVIVVPDPPEAPWSVELLAQETVRRFRVARW